MTTHDEDLVRVIAADRQPMFREAVVRSLRRHAGMSLVAEAADGRAALDLVLRHRPHVAIIDADLPRVDGQRVVAAIAREQLPTRVLLLLPGTVSSRRGYDAIAAGAAGCLSRTTDEAELHRAVLEVARGRTVLGPEVHTPLAAEIRRRAGEASEVLSDRDRQVLLYLAEGLSVAEIAGELHLSPATVKTALVQLYRRLGVSERAAAVAVALRRGLIE